jgi:hypothetical protein
MEGMMARKKTKKKAKRKTAPALTYPDRLAPLEAEYMSLARRIARVEEFLGDDLKEFHEKQKIAADPLARAASDG